MGLIPTGDPQRTIYTGPQIIHLKDRNWGFIHRLLSPLVWGWTCRHYLAHTSQVYLSCAPWHRRKPGGRKEEKHLRVCWDTGLMWDASNAHRTFQHNCTKIKRVKDKWLTVSKAYYKPQIQLSRLYVHSKSSNSMGYLLSDIPQTFPTQTDRNWEESEAHPWIQIL